MNIRDNLTPGLRQCNHQITNYCEKPGTDTFQILTPGRMDVAGNEEPAMLIKIMGRSDMTGSVLSFFVHKEHL